MFNHIYMGNIFKISPMTWVSFSKGFPDWSHQQLWEDLPLLVLPTVWLAAWRDWLWGQISRAKGSCHYCLGFSHISDDQGLCLFTYPNNKTHTVIINQPLCTCRDFLTTDPSGSEFLPLWASVSEKCQISHNRPQLQVEFSLVGLRIFTGFELVFHKLPVLTTNIYP